MTTRSRIARMSLALATACALTGGATAQIPSAANLAVPAGTEAAQFTPRGQIDVVLKLADAPLAQLHGREAKRRGSLLSREQARAHKDALQARQDAVMQSVRAFGGKELARTKNALNAVVVRIDASQLRALSQIGGVASVRPVRNYTRDLAETVPYIGAAAAQAAGKDGSGVTVAVLDSGIDYTHRNLGGPGTVAAFQAAYGSSNADPRNTTLDGLFPTDKVVGGFDFVGESWPNGDLAEDPDPIDFQGHGTHVADIIAGRSSDGAHKGVAPGARLLAVKVCSAVATSCSGVALLKGVDFALDPNGDGDIADAADVINMSLGAAYGQAEDDLSEASANAVRLGVVVVASAGNNADRPYITGSPASTPEVISVAQTQVPSASTFAVRITAPAALAGRLLTNTATVEWAPVGAGFSGAVAVTGPSPATNLACAALPAGSLAGRVALIDRGTCAVSVKVHNAANAGAIGVLIANNAAGDAPSFSFGGPVPFNARPTVVLTQADGNLLRANLAAGVAVTVDPSTQIPLVGSMASTSSRGPNVSYSQIKPDIGAPGASISAIAGSGTGTEAFGGTSGAAPMVSGSAAILLQANPGATPAEIRARLMNTANTAILTNPASQPGVPAPITRIGAGEVRVNRALDSTLLAVERDSGVGALSFGFVAAHDNRTLNKQVEVTNLGSQDRVLTITPSFRYANDQASGAVTLRAPNSVRVRAGDSARFNVQLRVNAAALPSWNLNGSALGNGVLLNNFEFDGFVTLADAAGSVSLPWQVLPRKSAHVEARPDDVRAGGSVTLTNDGVEVGAVDVFALTGESRKVPKKELPQPGDNFAIIDLKAVGARLVDIGGGQFGVQFAVTTFGERAHPNYPAQFQVEVDSNNDGTVDFVVFNGEAGAFGSSGVNVVNVFNVTTGAISAFFFTDATFNSANAILTAPLSALGLTPASTFRFSVYGVDNYFTGNATDAIENMVFTLGTPRYVGTGIPAAGVPAGGSATLQVQAVPGGATASPSQTGLLLMYRNARTRKEADAIVVRP